MFVEVSNIKKSYGEGGSYVQVLKGVSVGVEKGEMCVIQGTSGSGKSTLLNCIGGLDEVDSGSIKIDRKEIVGLKGEKLSDYRRDNLGFIFQFYNLIPNLTIRENIQVCEYLTKDALDMNELLDVLGLTEHQNKFPSQLSGGQQQRCAIARALIKNINKQYGTTMLIVTHNNSIKNMVDHVIYIKDGEVSKNYLNEVKIPAAELEDL